LLKHLIEAVIIYGKIKRTTAKAKELSVYLDKLVTIAKKNNLSSAKAVHSKLSDAAAKKLMTNVVKKYRERNGGYTRIIKVGDRKHDAAKMSIIEFV